ncbi:MAG TPA: CpsD/CapB family tyrosine-protein kinase, partial [Pyrinomonadaceae bacterium]|nr:CpsD/CapB family tyrosine-protein kinase [Pyrinomonadaceae bacterium]
HKIFGMENEDGLSTILSDEVGDVEALKVIRHHEKSGVDVLTSGPVVAEATEYLGSDQMRKLVSTFRFTYDYIVIDSPPVAYFADGVLLSALVDGVVLVVNSGESVRDTVRQAYQTLQDVGANIYGVVLNNAKGVDYDYDYYAKD